MVCVSLLCMLGSFINELRELSALSFALFLIPFVLFLNQTTISARIVFTNCYHNCSSLLCCQSYILIYNLITLKAYEP